MVSLHLAIWLMPKPKDQAAPFDANHSWLLGDQRALAVLLAVAAATFLVAGGPGLWAQAGWWRGMIVVGHTTSFGLMVAYFNPWYLPIEGVNAALIVGIIWLTWPSKDDGRRLRPQPSIGANVWSRRTGHEPGA